MACRPPRSRRRRYVSTVCSPHRNTFPRSIVNWNPVFFYNPMYEICCSKLLKSWFHPPNVFFVILYDNILTECSPHVRAGVLGSNLDRVYEFILDRNLTLFTLLVVGVQFWEQFVWERKQTAQHLITSYWRGSRGSEMIRRKVSVNNICLFIEQTPTIDRVSLIDRFRRTRVGCCRPTPRPATAQHSSHTLSSHNLLRLYSQYTML